MAWRQRDDASRSVGIGLLRGDVLLVGEATFYMFIPSWKVPMWIRALQLFAILGLLPAMNAILAARLYQQMTFYFALVLLMASASRMHLTRMEGRRIFN